jgi:hypothetical protein
MLVAMIAQSSVVKWKTDPFMRGASSSHRA